MKNIIIKNGIISGLIVSAFMVMSMAWCYKTESFEGSMLIGYASMLAAFSFIFIGVKKYRDTLGEGPLSFGTAFKIGLGIASIASLMYAVAWALEYHFFMPDFLDKMIDATATRLKSENIDPDKLKEKLAQAEAGRVFYSNIFFFLGITFLEIFPVGLIVSVVSALILKKK